MNITLIHCFRSWSLMFRHLINFDVNEWLPPLKPRGVWMELGVVLYSIVTPWPRWRCNLSPLPWLFFCFLFFHMINTPRWRSLSVFNIHTIPQHQDACQDSLWQTHTHTHTWTNRKKICYVNSWLLTSPYSEGFFFYLLIWHYLHDIKCKVDLFSFLFFYSYLKIACFLLNVEADQPWCNYVI